MNRSKKLLCGLLFLIPCVLMAANIDPALQIALQQSSAVRALVLLQAPPAKLQTEQIRRDGIRRSVDALLESLPPVRVKRRYELVPALALELDAQALAQLAKDPSVIAISFDAPGSGHLVQSAPLAGLSSLYALGANFTGLGVKVAVVDTGIDTDHSDFDGRLVAQQCFCAGAVGSVGCCPNALDTQSGAGAAEDDHGHGTNVTGIVTGDGSVALRGAVSAADIVSVKVLDSTNSFCCVSDVVAAFDWIRVNHPDTAVVNASLGTFALSAVQCDTGSAPAFMQIVALATKNLVDNGTMVFISSGNQGSATSLPAPACAASAITVGAVWDFAGASASFLGCTEARAVDLPTCFTNSNSMVDLYAPGAFVTASGLSNGNSSFGGTSQASPMSAGCAALLISRFPNASPAEIEAAMKASPNTVIDPKNSLSFPRLNCQAAHDLLNFDVFADGFET